MFQKIESRYFTGKVQAKISKSSANCDNIGLVHKKPDKGKQYPKRNFNDTSNNMLQAKLIRN